jgi:cation diffusion facilitator CzcD-associated flavoprotein CzcO
MAVSVFNYEYLHSTATDVAQSKTFPKFIPKEKVADFLEAYAIGHEIHVWLAATVLPTPTYDIATGRWTVNVDREGDIVTLAPKHIVMATGNGPTKVPMWRGMDSFSGHLYHSDQHHGAAPFKGKRVIIVGAVCVSFSVLYVG